MGKASLEYLLSPCFDWKRLFAEAASNSDSELPIFALDSSVLVSSDSLVRIALAALELILLVIAYASVDVPTG